MIYILGKNVGQNNIISYQKRREFKIALPLGSRAFPSSNPRESPVAFQSSCLPCWPNAKSRRNRRNLLYALSDLASQGRFNNDRQKKKVLVPYVSVIGNCMYFYHKPDLDILIQYGYIHTSVRPNSKQMMTRVCATTLHITSSLCVWSDRVSLTCDSTHEKKVRYLSLWFDWHSRIHARTGSIHPLES